MERLEYDRRRDEYLRLKGYRVLRFWNEAIFKNMEAVVSEILRALEGG